MSIFNTMKWKLAQFLELIWWKRYLRNKEVKDYIVWKKKYWNSFIEKTALKPYITRGRELLDIGCGPAGIFIVLEEKEVTAVDPLIDNYESNLKHFKKGNYPYVSFVSKAFENFDSKQTFDVVFCLNAINHFKDFDYSLKKLQGLLKKEGVLILSIDVHRFSLLKYIFRLIPGDMLHPHQHTRNDYLQMLKSLTKMDVVRREVLEKGNIFNYEVLVCKNREA